MIQLKAYFISRQAPIKVSFATREKYSVPINERFFNFQKSVRITVSFYRPIRTRVLIKTGFWKSIIFIRVKKEGKARLPIKTNFWGDRLPSGFLQYLSELGVSVS